MKRPFVPHDVNTKNPPTERKAGSRCLEDLFNPFVEVDEFRVEFFQRMGFIRLFPFAVFPVFELGVGDQVLSGLAWILVFF